MLSYAMGIFFGISAGIANFLGQVLQKKAINDVSASRTDKDKGLMKLLIKNKTWIAGIIIMAVFTSIFMFLAQLSIGGAMVPGLMASGFIVLAIGSVVILKEKLGAKEILSIILLLAAVVLIALSQLSIEASLDYFNDVAFSIRFYGASILFLALWMVLFYGGKKAKQFKSVLLALGTGFPFVINNLWMGPFSASVTMVLAGQLDLPTLIFFIIGTIVIIIANVLGLGHYQYALEAGDASRVVPMQQSPQQIAPIIIYYIIYQLPNPTQYSFALLSIAIVFIIIAGFVLGSRQAALEKIK